MPLLDLVLSTLVLLLPADLAFTCGRPLFAGVPATFVGARRLTARVPKTATTANKWTAPPVGGRPGARPDCGAAGNCTRVLRSIGRASPCAVRVGLYLGLALMRTCRR